MLSDICPDEIYNLGAQSHVAVSFQVPEYTGEVDAIGTIRLLNSVKDLIFEDDVNDISEEKLLD